MNGIEMNFVGRLGKDPELRISAKGNSWATFNVAVDRFIGPKNPDGSREKTTQWVRVKTFNELAENVAATLQTGAPVHVTGTFELDTWTGNDGQERTDVVCIANEVGLNLRRTQATWTRPVRTDGGFSAPSAAPSQEPMSAGADAGADDEPF